MASLTPGVLSKLLQHASTDVRVAGEHRSVLLQVIGIVPSGGSDDPLQSSGFFLKVSDSLHSTYVSISDEDADLIFSDKIQLGQFVHVARLDAASPVPVLRGVKPVPRRRPCIGNPTDLVASDLLPFRRSAESRSEGKADRRASLGGSCREEKRLSLDSLRRSWEKAAGAPKKNVLAQRRPLDSKWKENSTASDSAPVVLPDKVSPKIDSSLRRRSLGNSPLKNESKHLSLRPTNKPSKRDTKLSVEAIVPGHLVEVHVSPKNWHRTISWDVLPSSLHALGKDTLHHRNATFLAAVEALQEASAAESVIQCLSMFSELCDSARQVSPKLLVEQFLDLHKSMQQVATITDAMLKIRYREMKNLTSTTSQLTSDEVTKIFYDKKADAMSWVQAALEAELSSFSLLTRQDKRGSLNSNKHHHVVLDTSPDSTDSRPRNPATSYVKQSLKKRASLSAANTKGASPSRQVAIPARIKTDNEKGRQLRESGLKDTASLGKSLVLVSRAWFLTYLDDLLSDDFRGRDGDGDGEIVVVLGQLKRVNQWLEDMTREGLEVDGSIEKLKKKLYRFLLQHLDSAAIASREAKY